MFDFGTSSGQVVYPCRTNIGTSSGQALVPINKHIQTIENNKNINKQENLKKLNLKNSKDQKKQEPSVPYQDNLKTTSDKDYNVPL